MCRKCIHCQRLFTGLDDACRLDQTVVVEQGRFSFVGPQAEAPPPALRWGGRPTFC